METAGMTTIVISADAAPLLGVARQVLDGEDLPEAALIGGLAVTVRVASPAILCRATADIDIEVGHRPTAVLEAAVGVLLRPTGRLDHAIEAHELTDDDPHVGSLVAVL